MENLEFYLNNREVIKNLALNTGTSTTPAFTNLCTTSEVGLDTEFETKDWYTFCDAIKRSLIMGAAITINTTVKIDMNNTAITGVLGDLHALIGTGEIRQFNNKLIQFELIHGVEDGVLTYKKYQVAVNLILSDLGGAAEDEGEFSLEIRFNSKGKDVTSN